MFINRNNYEDFFLLYVDGELNASERKVVEDFAAANADLKQELDILKQTVLPADEVLFEDKGTLLRPVPLNCILQEKLLLKTDNELGENELAALNILIASDENVQHEFALLQSTKLNTSEKIFFADKYLLYRREKDNVIAGRFVKRAAAAAVLIGFGLFFGISQFNKNDRIDTAKNDIRTLPAKVNPPVISQHSTASADIQPGINKKDRSLQNAATTADQNIVKTTVDNKAGLKNSNNVTRDTENNVQQNNTVIPDNQTVLIPKQKVDNILPEEKIIEGAQQQTAALIVPGKISTGSDNNIIPPENTYAMATSYNPDEKSENKILYMDEDDVKRSKAGGFLRKIKRFVERTAKIKPGNSLKIASFEFAAR